MSEAKTKTKTRAVLAPEIEAPVPPVLPVQAEDLQPKFILKQRAYKVISTIFHNPLSPNQPGEIPWTDFLMQ